MNAVSVCDWPVHMHEASSLHEAPRTGFQGEPCTCSPVTRNCGPSHKKPQQAKCHEDISACDICLVQGDKQVKALFQMFVAFEPKGMSFTPNEAAVLEEINANTLEGIISVAAVGHRPLASYAAAWPLSVSRVV